MRTHLIMNSHKLATQDRGAECRAGPGCGEGKDGRRDGRGCVLEGVTQRCFGRCRKRSRIRKSCDGTARRRAIELPTAGRNRRIPTKDSRRVRRRATAKEKATRRSSRASATSVARRVTCRRIASPKKRVHPRGEGLAETGCIDMASIDLNALEIGAVQLREGDRKIRIGTDSCAAVTVFPKTVADDYTRCSKRQAKQRVTGRRQASFCRILVREQCRSSSQESLRYVNPRVADTHRALMAVSEMNDMGHDVFSPRSDRDRCVPQGQWHEAGARVSEWSFRVACRACSFFLALEQIEDMMVKIARAERPN